MEMKMLPIIIIAVLLVIIGLVGYDLWKKKRENSYKEADYYVLFVMGPIWILCGLILMGILFFLSNPFALVIGLPFFVMGFIYGAIGLAKKGKWGTRTQRI